MRAKIYSAVFASQKSSGTLHFRFAHPHLTGLKEKIFAGFSRISPVGRNSP